MLPDISRAFLTKMMEGEQVAKVQVNVTDGEFSYGFG
jgi:type VI secretion system protein VasG